MMFFSPGVFKSLENSPTYVRFRVHLPGQANFVLACQVLESPHLEKFQLTLDPTILPAPGPPLPLRAPHGRPYTPIDWLAVDFEKVERWHEWRREVEEDLGFELILNIVVEV